MGGRLGHECGGGDGEVTWMGRAGYGYSVGGWGSGGESVLRGCEGGMGLLLRSYRFVRYRNVGYCYVGYRFVGYCFVGFGVEGEVGFVFLRWGREREVEESECIGRPAFDHDVILVGGVMEGRVGS